MKNHPLVNRTLTFTVYIQQMCELSYLPNDIPPQVVTVNDKPPLTINITAFTFIYSATCVPNTILYKATQDGGSLQSYITFDKSVPSFTISPNTNTQKGTSTLMVIGYIVGSLTGNTYSANISIMLTINPFNSAPPAFTATPSDQ